MSEPDPDDKPTMYERAVALLRDPERGPTFRAISMSALTLVFGMVAAASATAMLVGVASRGWAAFIALCGFAGACEMTRRFAVLENRATVLLWQFEHPMPTLPTMASLPALPPMPPHPLLASPDGHPLISLAQMRERYGSFGEPRRTMALELIDEYEAWREQAVARGGSAELREESLRRAQLVHEEIGRILAAHRFQLHDAHLDSMYDLFVTIDAEALADAIGCVCGATSWCDRELPMRPWTEAECERASEVFVTAGQMASALYDEYLAEHPELTSATEDAATRGDGPASC